MLLRTLVSKRSSLLPRAISCRSHFSSDRQNPTWVSSNSLFRKHPRLIALEKCHSLRQLKPVLSYTIVSGLLRNPFVASRVIYLCSVVDVGSLTYAALVFGQMEEPNLFSWNTMIRGFSESGKHHPSIAFSLYAQMLERRIQPDKYTFPFLLKACNSVSDLNMGKLVHAHCLALAFDMDSFVQTTLVNMYLGCGCVDDARQLFGGMSERDVVSWSGMISGLVDQGYFEQALEVFNDMRSDGSDVRPNVATMVSTMSACAGLGSLDHGRALHAYLEKVGLAVDVFITNSVIDVYAKCGSIDCSSQVFDAMIQRDLHSWTAIIMGLATHGLGEEALNVFSDMKRVGVMPDSVTFVAVLSACSHAGLVDEGVRNFESMEREYKIVPDLKHYGCMVDLFSRAGLLNRAYELVSTMPMEPNLVVLGALLSACRVHNNLELGEVVSKKIEFSCEYKGGAHVLLSNIYANENQWHEVVLVRKGMMGDAWKPPGRSWIEVRGVVHEFVAEDKSHPEAREMKLILDGLGKLI